MVKPAQLAGLVCALALLSVFPVRAKDLADYHVGDTADENITTPVPLDVIDADATVARKASEELKTPAIFRSYPEITNEILSEVSEAFAQAHSNFLAGLQETFRQTTLDEQTIQSPDFGYFITAFNLKNKKFPINSDLARRWAGGDDGLATQASIIELLMQTMRRSVRPDELPIGLTLGDTVRLVPVRNPKQALTANDAEQRGKLVTRTSIATLSRLRVLFRQNFPADDQLIARALAAFLRPNCEPDADLTRQVRDRAVSQLVVAYHYDAGQVVVRSGQTIDSKIQAALDELNEKLLPGQLNQQIAAERDRVQSEQAQAQQAQAQAQREQEQARQEHEQAVEAANLAQSERDQALKMHEQAMNAQNQELNIRARNEWLIVALAGVSVVALAAFWILARNRRREVSLLPALLPQNQAALKADFAPQLAQALKEAVVQELAAQRSELLKAQRSAAAEIGELVHRLDQLQAPMQERLRTYEMKIEQLEKELAARNEENHELLKLKIEMIRRQLEAERAGSRMEFN